jgi:DNA-binding response OmpR family regulator
MAGKGPNILVLDADRDERAAIVALLRQAGFGVVAAAAERGATAALQRARFAAAVIAPPSGHAIEWVRQLRSRQADLRTLLVAEAAVLPLIGADYGTFVRRPYDPRQILGCVLELVLRDDSRPSRPSPALPPSSSSPQHGLPASVTAGRWRAPPGQAGWRKN